MSADRHRGRLRGPAHRTAWRRQLRLHRPGHFAGEFHAAPTFLLEEEPDEPPSDEPRNSELTPEEWVEHMRTIEVDAPEQFRRAQHGVGIRDRDTDEDDD